MTPSEKAKMASPQLKAQLLDPGMFFSSIKLIIKEWIYLRLLRLEKCKKSPFC